jgi:hypothetical protein
VTINTTDTYNLKRKVERYKEVESEYISAYKEKHGERPRGNLTD